jgi:hypothetical protein
VVIVNIFKIKHLIMRLVPTIYVFFTVGMAALIFASCTVNTQSGKPRSTGTTSEILIVTDSKDTWEGPVGDTIRKWFSQPIPALSQPEQMFDMLNIASKDFNDLFKKFHNILIININQDPTKPASSKLTENVWSAPQRVITLSAPDVNSFFDEFNLKKKYYLDIFNQLERKRIEVLNRMAGDISLQKKVTDKFDLFLSLPGGFYIASEAPGFIWLRHKVVKGKQDVELGIMVYMTEYLDTAQLNPRYILNWRNIQTKQYVPGPSEGSYMVTSTDYIPPVVSYPEEFPMDFTVEIRGLWKVENDFMGGPFINYTFVDENKNRLICMDGYVYNPNEFKRNYLRQLESIFYTLKLTE